LRKSLSQPDFKYRGRFAPSPTGPLHFGSLVAAVGSYLDAKHHNGTWLVRMEDLDTPRCIQGAADDILRTLEAFGLLSDEPVLFQNERVTAYDDALRKLQTISAIYPCSCTRKEIADSALQGIDGQIYPGTCRNGITVGHKKVAWRTRTNDNEIAFDDVLQGRITQHLESDIGDFVVKRADGLFAYQLAVVIDDAYQGVTHVVRGADLLASTPRQIYLQRLLDLPTPEYMHLPVVVNEQGEKLSKQTLALPVVKENASATLFDALVFLRQLPPAHLRRSTIEQIKEWAIENWQPGRLLNCAKLPMTER